MGLLSTLFSTKRPARKIARLQGDGSYSVEVVGESNYVNNLWHAAGALGQGDRVDVDEVRVFVTLEPSNPYDPKAVVVQTPEGLTLGYLPRGSPLYGPIRDAGGSIEVLANIRGSYSHREDRWLIGIFLDIA